MKRHQLFKSASDFAYETLDNKDPAALDIAVAERFKKEGLNPADYTLWKQFFQQSRQQLVALASQNAPSFKPAPAPSAAVKPVK